MSHAFLLSIGNLCTGENLLLIKWARNWTWRAWTPHLSQASRLQWAHLIFFMITRKVTKKSFVSIGCLFCDWAFICFCSQFPVNVFSFYSLLLITSMLFLFCDPSVMSGMPFFSFSRLYTLNACLYSTLTAIVQISILVVTQISIVCLNSNLQWKLLQCAVTVHSIFSLFELAINEVWRNFTAMWCLTFVMLLMRYTLYSTTETVSDFIFHMMFCSQQANQRQRESSSCDGESKLARNCGAVCYRAWLVAIIPTVIILIHFLKYLCFKKRKNNQGLEFNTWVLFIFHMFFLKEIVYKIDLNYDELVSEIKWCV